LGLRKREHQLSARHAARTHLDRCRAALAGKLTIKQSDKPQRSRDRADHRESRERREALVISPEVNPSDAFGTVSAVHLQGELRSRSQEASQPQRSRSSQTESPATSGAF